MGHLAYRLSRVILCDGVHCLAECSGSAGWAFVGRPSEYTCLAPPLGALRTAQAAWFHLGVPPLSHAFQPLRSCHSIARPLMTHAVSRDENRATIICTSLASWDRGARARGAPQWPAWPRGHRACPKPVDRGSVLYGTPTRSAATSRMRTDTTTRATRAARNPPVRSVAGCFTRLELHLLTLRLNCLPAYVLRSVRRSG